MNCHDVREHLSPLLEGHLGPTMRAAVGEHLLARGMTHLPYAQPKYGTPCAATQPPASILTPGTPKDAQKPAVTEVKSNGQVIARG